MNTELKRAIFRAQAGPQSLFLSLNADIIFYGGSAGGGKTAAIMLDNVRNVLSCSMYKAVVFRRESAQIGKAGGLFDSACEFFGNLGKAKRAPHFSYVFDANRVIDFLGMQRENDKLKLQGIQYDAAYFDELTHFTETQFSYMRSRLRSISGQMEPYVRATCNPEPGWVADFIDWYIDDDGYAIEERSGIIRYFVELDDRRLWFDQREVAQAYIIDNQLEKDASVTSFTFIRAKLEDNQILLQNDPSYRQRLNSLSTVDRLRLIKGNWKVREGGKLFKREDFKYYSELPLSDLRETIITVDTAQKTDTHNDYTVMQVWRRHENGSIYLIDQLRVKVDAPTQQIYLKNLILTHKPAFVCVEQQANGASLVQYLNRDENINVNFRLIHRHKDKYTRAMQAQKYIREGRVFINAGADYFNAFLNEVTSFAPENKNIKNVHDDQVDCMLDAVEALIIKYDEQLNVDIREYTNVEYSTLGQFSGSMF